MNNGTEILITSKMKCICINLTKYVKDMYAENYKVLINKIKTEISEEHTVYKDWKIPHSKDSIFPYSIDLYI